MLGSELAALVSLRSARNSSDFTNLMNCEPHPGLPQGELFPKGKEKEVPVQLFLTL